MIDAPDHSIRAELDKKYRFESIIGHHPKIIQILELISQIADTEATVLIYGESGTGKELVSRALHDNSSRRNMPFVPLNCGAIPDTLLESELFGHLQGAFTGAYKEKQGWFACADGGSIFLDEIHAMSPALQMKLLRVLQTGEYTPVGSTEFRKVDVRILAATSKNLSKLVEKELFREELFYRINVIDMTLPPLRKRKSDIPLLIEHFKRIYSAKYKKEPLQLSDVVRELLYNYHYPGNVRELRNIVERVVILTKEEIIECGHLPDSIFKAGNSEESNSSFSPFKEEKQLAVEKFECEYIIECLRRTKGNITRAAHLAGIHVTHFYSKIKQYDINPHLFKVKR